MGHRATPSRGRERRAPGEVGAARIAAIHLAEDEENAALLGRAGKIYFHERISANTPVRMPRRVAARFWTVNIKGVNMLKTFAAIVTGSGVEIGAAGRGSI